MHPCDAKGIFFSEVEVLRAHQSKRPVVAEFHVICVGVGDGAHVGADRLVFCAHRTLSFVFV